MQPLNESKAMSATGQMASAVDDPVRGNFNFVEEDILQEFPSIPSDDGTETYHSLGGDSITFHQDEDEDEELYEAAPDIIASVTAVQELVEANEHEERGMEETCAESTDSESNGEVDKDEHVADQGQDDILLDTGDVISVPRSKEENSRPLETVEEETTSFILVNPDTEPETPQADGDHTYCLKPSLGTKTSYGNNPFEFQPTLESPQTSTSTSPGSMNRVETELTAEALKTNVTIYVDMEEPEELSQEPSASHDSPHQLKRLADGSDNGEIYRFIEMKEMNAKGEGIYNPCFQGDNAHSITACEANACQVVSDDSSASRENDLEDERTFNDIINQLRDESGIYNPDLEEITIISLAKDDEEIVPDLGTTKVVFGGVEELPYPNAPFRPESFPGEKHQQSCCNICCLKVKKRVLSAEAIFLIFLLMFLAFCIIMRLVFDGPAHGHLPH